MSGWSHTKKVLTAAVKHMKPLAQGKDKDDESEEDGEKGRRQGRSGKTGKPREPKAKKEKTPEVGSNCFDSVLLMGRICRRASCSRTSRRP